MKEKREILVPSGWNEITIEALMELQQLKKEEEDYDVQLISILCDVDPDIVSRLTLPTYSAILLNLSWLAKLPTEVDYKPIIKIGENEFGIIKLSQLTNGEWYSIEEWLSDPSKNLHKLLAMIYRPLVTALNDNYRITEPYDTHTAEERAEIFKSCKVADLYGAFVFFYHIERECMKTIKDYLQIQVVVTGMRIPKKMRLWMLKRSLQRWSKGNGHGIPFFTRLLKGILGRSKKSPDITLSSL